MHPLPRDPKVWIIEPRDPLIARDGRPFQNTPGARATSLRFPYPSTTTGGLRHRAGRGANGLFDRDSQTTRVKTVGVSGPLLVQLDDNGDIEQWMAPAPADALIVQPDGKHPHVHPLVPLTKPTGAETNMPDGLNLVGPVHPDPSKPAKGPSFWYWDDTFWNWLIAPCETDDNLETMGNFGPPIDVRTHVAIEQRSQAALEGALFQTRGLEFTGRPPGGVPPLSVCRRLALAVISSEDVAPGLAALGGERRLVAWRSSNKPLPECRAALRQSIIESKACRLILLTPGCFDAGYRPSHAVLSDGGVVVEIKAAAVNRAQVISGWDLDIKRPKPVRRLAPAGSVYFVTLKGSNDAIGQWIDQTWLACISDQSQDRLDGFGLVALGTWSGTCQAMSAGKEDAA